MILDYRDVAVVRAGKHVLSGVNWQVHDGEFIYLTGVVGSGKSSLLKTIYGELEIVSGSASVMGYDMMQIRRHEIPALRRQLGIVFQDFQLLSERTVFKNLDFVLKSTGWNDKSARKCRVEEVLAHVGLSDAMMVMPHELSGGEQQRICLARAILNKPRLILADEAIGNQDEASSKKMLTLLYDLAQQGTAVIFTTHNEQIIPKFPGKVYTCQGGKLISVSNDGPVIPSRQCDDIPLAVVAPET